MKELTLLEKAKSHNPQHRMKTSDIGPQHVALALAWARDEISLTQASVTLGVPNNNQTKTYIVISKALRQYIQSQKA